LESFVTGNECDNELLPNKDFNCYNQIMTRFHEAVTLQTIYKPFEIFLKKEWKEVTLKECLDLNITLSMLTKEINIWENHLSKHN